MITCSVEGCDAVFVMSPKGYLWYFDPPSKRYFCPPHNPPGAEAHRLVVEGA